MDNKVQFETDPQQLETDEKTVNDVILEDEEVKPIKYGTHKKLLNQYKNIKTEADELREYKRQREEEESLKRGEFDKIIGALKEENNELKSKVTNNDRDKTDSKKLDGFLKKLPGKVKRDKYLAYVDLDKIAIDPDTGELDELSLERQVKSFVNECPELIELANPKRLPVINGTGETSRKVDVKTTIKKMTNEQLRIAYLKSEELRHGRSDS